MTDLRRRLTTIHFAPRPHWRAAKGAKRGKKAMAGYGLFVGTGGSEAPHRGRAAIFPVSV